MKTISIHKIKLSELIKVLKDGGLVIAPSDTVYGLLVDSTNEIAVEKLITFKSRPPGKAISVFVSDFSMMKQYIYITPKQESVLKELLPGPFTVVLNSKHRTFRLLESEKGTLGVRIPMNQFIGVLVKKFGKPITATSANLSGSSPHYQIDTLLKEIPKSKQSLIDLVIDAGKLPHNKPSTVIDLTTSTVKTLRQGDIMRSSIQSFISTSAEQTKKIGQYLLHKYEKEIIGKPLVFIIEGELGVGKTVMVKGIAEMLGITNIVSPTFVVYYEYDIKISNFPYRVNKSQISKIIHFDLYNVQDSEEFKYLGIENLLKPQVLLCFEWGEKTGEIIDLLKSKARIVYITMKYVSEREREIKVTKLL